MLKVANSVINASRITGVLPVANGGTGVTTSTGTGNTVLSASPTLSGDVNLSTGNLIIGTAGKGIDFSVTSSGSGTMTSELLADYEEGTWTPNQGSGLTVVGTFYSLGQYTKVGRLVTASGYVAGTTTASAAGLGVITSNLPFTVGSRTIAGSIFVTGSVPAATTCAASASSTEVYNATAIAATTGQIYFNVTYEV
jgi:hypothetical protein